MIHEEKQVAEDTEPTTDVKIFGLHELFLPRFSAFSESKKNYQRKSGALKHAIVNHNKF